MNSGYEFGDLVNFDCSARERHDEAERREYRWDRRRRTTQSRREGKRAQHHQQRALVGWEKSVLIRVRLWTTPDNRHMQKRRELISRGYMLIAFKGRQPYQGATADIIKWHIPKQHSEAFNDQPAPSDVSVSLRPFVCSARALHH